MDRFLCHSAERCQFPKDKIDLVTVFAHELGHALGINGRLDRNDWSIASGQSLSQFDAHIVNRETSEPAFRGPATYAVYGGDLPLTIFRQNDMTVDFICKGKKYQAGVSKSQNYYHYGRFTKPNESPLRSLRLDGGRLAISRSLTRFAHSCGKLDVAILKDYGRSDSMRKLS